MKKLTITLFSLLFLTAVAHAQSGLGVKGGVNLTNITTNAGNLKANIMESYETRTGFAFGLWGRVGNKLFLQPELMIATKGGSIDVVPVGGGTSQTVNIKYTDLDVPVLVGFKLLNFLKVMGGPVASFKVAENQSFKDAIKSYTNDPKDAFANASFGYQAGVGFKVRSIEIDVRRQGSLSDISQLNLPNEPKFSQRAAGWQVTAAFKIL